MNTLNDGRWRPSVTVAAVIELNGRYLLVEEHTAEGLRLNNPAGHLEPGESLVEAVCREVLEETACRFTPTAMLPICMSRFQRPASGEDITYLRFAFIGSVTEPVPGRALDQGIVRTLWLTPSEIEAERARHRSPLLWQCISNHAQGRTLALDTVWVDPSIYAPEIKC